MKSFLNFVWASRDTGLFFSVGTLILMLMVPAFTYGMGV